MIEILILVYYAWNAIRVCIFAIIWLAILTFVHSSQLNNQNCLLLKLILILNKNRNLQSSNKSLKYQQQQNTILLEHHLLNHQKVYENSNFVAQYINRKLISSLMFVSLFTNIIGNALMIRQLLYGKYVGISQ